MGLDSIHVDCEDKGSGVVVDLRIGRENTCMGMVSVSIDIKTLSFISFYSFLLMSVCLYLYTKHNIFRPSTFFYRVLRIVVRLETISASLNCTSPCTVGMDFV